MTRARTANSQWGKCRLAARVNSRAAYVSHSRDRAGPRRRIEERTTYCPLSRTVGVLRRALSDCRLFPPPPRLWATPAGQDTGAAGRWEVPRARLSQLLLAITSRNPSVHA
eukprot:scaffold86424_cov36-Tisochrysis_lutea.AAC.1